MLPKHLQMETFLGVQKCVLPHFFWYHLHIFCFLCMYVFFIFENDLIILSDKSFSFSSNVIVITQYDKKQLLYEGLFVSK